MKVLIIEDDIMWQCKLQIIAERARLDIAHIAVNINDASLALQEKKIDLIIADIHLNNENVFSLFNNKIYKNIPTILTTASETQEDFLNSKKLSNCVFLVKPFHHHTLLSAINFLKKNTQANTAKTTIENDTRISSTEIRNFYKILADDSVINLFKLKDTESYILKKRWSESKSFSEIGKDLKLSSQRIQRVYAKTISKIKTKMLSSIPKYQEYLEFSKNKKGKLEIIKNTIETQRSNTENNTTRLDAKMSIDSIESLNTKFRNVLWDKKIRTVEDLLQYSKRDLLKFNKLGPFAILEIEKALAERGFELKT